MKKLLYLIIVMLVLGLIVTGCIPVVPPEVQNETSGLTKAKPIKPPSGAHYNLNIIGKKLDWNGGGSYNNWDRHTMFVPENTDDFELNGTPCFAPAPLPEGAEEPVGPGITIWMTSCDNKINSDSCDFAVLDGNAFDDCKCEFQLAPGKYEVWIVAKAKPNGYTDITGWLYDPNLEEYYLKTDANTIRVSSTGKDWTDATDLFYYEGQWVFDYLQNLIDDPLLDSGAYFWQFDNNGNKLVQVRFYPVD